MVRSTFGVFAFVFVVVSWCSGCGACTAMMKLFQGDWASVIALLYLVFESVQELHLLHESVDVSDHRGQ